MGLSLQSTLNRSQQLIRSGLLCNIADPTSPKSRAKILQINLLGHENQFGMWNQLSKLERCVNSVQLGHANIENNQVGLEHRRIRQEPSPIR